MTYKVVVVTTGSGSCCSTGPSLNQEVEKTCNQMATQGYVLVSAYPEIVKDCANQTKVASFLIFARP